VQGEHGEKHTLGQLPLLPEDAGRLPLLPEDAGRYHVKIGEVDSRAVTALTDLLNDGLLELSISHAPVASPLTDEVLQAMEFAGEIIPTQRAEMRKRALSAQPEFQGSGFWYTDKNGQRIDLRDAAACIVVTITDKGRQVWNPLKSLCNRLENEAFARVGS
jgi:hypothetical protein